MYYYYDAPAANKIVNWYGVILKIHQIIFQSGMLPLLAEIAQSICLYLFFIYFSLHYFLLFLINLLTYEGKPLNNNKIPPLRRTLTLQ